MTGANSGNDSLKRKQLKKHKVLATGLFLLMLCVYIGCTFLLKTTTQSWIGYVKAFAEAAMVGALADWFAVTALFHHPLGLPVPHTNLIENSKKTIGNNLGNFVVTNFLNAHTLRPYIEKLSVSHYASHWLSGQNNVDLLVEEISKQLKRIIENADNRIVSGFIAKKANELIQDLKLNEIVSEGIKIIMQRGDHERLLNFVISKVKEYVSQHEELVKQRVKQESHFLIPGFVNNYIAGKLTSGIAKYLQEIQADPHHKIRKDVNQQLTVFAEALKTNPKWKADLQEMQSYLLQPEQLQGYAASVWKNVQQGIVDDLSSSESALQRYFRKSIMDVANSLQHDEELRRKIDQWVRYNAYNYILRNADKAGSLISNTVGDWEGKELSNKLELEVGKDLQFIRINGTLVGGLVGLLIYTITQFIIHH